ncbi:hypothetical protein INT47_003392 [Mucor saturninus]|uniref:HCP-like protein n=1 Tax=Mucor saturninus TaxID=64648 RepID=A0A8H7RFC0_9FUNG|nr:hypothetical protein INT47_003392 [Mucor saturninus]
MGANLSSEEKSTRSNRSILGKKLSSSSISSQAKSLSIIQHSNDLINNNYTAPSPLASVSEKRKGKLPEALNHLDTLTPINNSTVKRLKSQRVKRTSTSQPHYRERISSSFSVSGFSSNHDAFQFSSVADSVITDMSRFSFNSFMDQKLGEDNDYIMSVPDFEYPSRIDTNSPDTDNVSTVQEILDLLTQNPGFTYDILTNIFASPRIRNNPELQREAFKAAEVWSARPDDVSAKICVARCKLCGWGTTKNSRQGFKELQQLAEKDNWEAYYYLAQCCYNGVEQVISSNTSVSIQPIDQKLACSWYKKIIDTHCDIQSDRIDQIIAQAKLLIAVTNFTTDQITCENRDENIGYIKDSATLGNRKSEFLMALLLRTKQTTDSISAKEYYIRSANKNFAPSQIELGLLLLPEQPLEGVSWLNKAAALGDPRAYHHLGNIYEFGNHVHVNIDLAYANYQIAADNFNDSASQFRLGIHYSAGTLGLDRDEAKAFSYLSNAASQQHAESQYILGIMYRDGKIPGVRDSAQNKKEALRLFRQASSQSFHPAIIETALCYERGIGAAINHATATQYYEIAISIPGKYLSAAQLTFAIFLHKNGKYKTALDLYSLAAGVIHSDLNTHPAPKDIECTAKLMIALFYLDEKDTTTPYRPKEAFDMLINLTKNTTQSGEVHYWIAVCYEEGVSTVVKPNLSKSFEHYMISAKLNYSDSQFQVGHMLCKGLGVQEDRLAAFDWLHAASKQNHASALYYVGIYYYNGSGTIARNLDLARDYFRRAAELGNTESIISYAQICYGKVKENTLPASEIERFLQESIRWYKKAAHLNHPTGLRELGRIYGSKKDYKTSAEFYERAAKLNDALSTVILGGYYENGHGVKMNKETAASHYEKAIELGQPTALFAIAELYDKLKSFDKAYTYYERVTTDPRISKNLKSSKISHLKLALYSLNYDSFTLLNKASTSNNTSNDPTTIQESLFKANIHSLSTTEAFLLLKSLAENEKFTDAYFWIAQCYQDGNGVSQNSKAVLHWLEKSLKEGNDMNAAMELASIYQNGLYGVKKNIPYAYQLYQSCGERNIVVGQHKLGVIFWRGLEMIPINLGMAVIWFTRSARQGYAPSHWALGQIALENGDLHIAIAWWETAMKLNPVVPHMDHHLLTTTGDSEALIKLGKIIQQQQDFDDGSVTIYSGSTHSSIRDEVESLSRVQQENHGLAVQCFGQAALMGNVEGMYLTAQAWHKDKDYPVALENYEKAAAQGHIPSRIMCATYQIYGLGGKEIDTKAGYEELLSCSKSDTDAYIHLGRCCERGLGTDLNLPQALEWYYLSIKTTNSSESMFRVGQINAQQNDESESVYWYQQAITKDDHPRAHFRIAFYYVQGILKDNEYVLQPDLSIAVHHFRSAAKQNDQDAMYELGQLLLTIRDETCAVFSLDLQEEGLHWLEIAADKGSRDAQRELGNLYHSGREGDEDVIYNIGQDFEKAYDYFSFAAHLGDKTSALFLGTYYEHGICVPPNIDLAQTWYTVAVELAQEASDQLPLSHPSGWWPAQLCLARVLHQNTETQFEAYALFHTVFYSHEPEQHISYLEMMLAQYELYGLGGVTIQEEKAVLKLLHLAEQGYTKAFLQVAQCYENGVGVEQNLEKALEWYVALVHNPVIDQDNLDEDDLEQLSQAYFSLAEYYRLGKVVAIDQEKSHTLYQIAAERGKLDPSSCLY